MPNRLFQILLEREYLTKILLENRLDFLKQKYVSLLVSKINALHAEVFDNDAYEWLDDLFFQLDNVVDTNLSGTVQNSPKLKENAEKIFDWLVSLDPFPTKKYAQWILNTFVKHPWNPEDSYKITGYLTDFERIKQLLPVEQRDINKYKSYFDLYNAILPYKEQASKAQMERLHNEEMQGQAKVLYNDSEYKIVVPLTQEAACYFGVHTQWCTAAKDSDNLFDSYNKQGDLYIILDKKNNRRWQFHFETQQFMDENDRQVSPSDFVKTHPHIAAFFKALDEKNIVLQRPSYKVIKTSNGYILKNETGLMGAIFIGIRLDQNNQLARISDEWNVTPKKEIAKLLNDLKVIGNPAGYPIKDLYYRNNIWGTFGEVATPVVEISMIDHKREWKSIEIMGEHTNNTYIHFKLTANGLPTGDSEVILCSDGRAKFQNRAAYGSGGNMGPFIMRLIKARKDIRYWDKSSLFRFEFLDNKDKEWILEHRPTLCSIDYSYLKLGAVEPVKDAIMMALKTIDGGILHYEGQSWVDVHLLAYHFSQTQIKNAVHSSRDERSRKHIFNNSWLYHKIGGDGRSMQDYEQGYVGSDAEYVVMVPIADVVSVIGEDQHRTWYEMFLTQ